ncbi:hypothetical protein HHI36_015437 [Cryptolaemus montrouzieri]|uniref:Glucosidase II beta subunit N-terminal domain-containing protein n=1 Tax=Cryptolaemus montrouzieri TaxID=559131 RepID=A0ABD2N633_9CUCU
MRIIRKIFRAIYKIRRRSILIIVNLFFSLFLLLLFYQMILVGKHQYKSIKLESISLHKTFGLKIRGVPFHQMAYYGKNAFECIKSKERIKFSKVNDDYCDCEDGTDEPGTSACSNGFFYCNFEQSDLTKLNENGKIPSSKVDDGVCDCCDGSDENDSILPSRFLKYFLNNSKVICSYRC